MQVTSSGNAVRFVLDGDTYFQELEALLAAVEAAPPSADTYVRMAYWWISPDCHLGGAATDPTLVQRLTDVGAAGHRVQVIAWLPNVLDTTLEGLAAAEGAPSAMIPDPGSADAAQAEGMLGGIVSDHKALEAAFADDPNVTVYLERYDGWWGASTHQKFTIVAIEGELTVLLGGLNLADVYYAAPDHAHSVWHDTALQIRGAATLDVEREFIRRWSKGYTQLPILRNQVPLAGSVFKALVARFVGAVTAPPELQPVATGVPVDVTLCTTNSESWFSRDVDIQAPLVARIAAARSYIYLENFALFDPTLVDALYDRMAAPRPPKLIVMIPRPDTSPNAYLNDLSWLKIALATATSITTPSGVVQRAQCSRWQLANRADDWTTMRSVTSTFSNRWMEEDALLVQGRRDAEPTVVRLDTISAVDTDFCFYTAVNGAGQDIYIHSKLALFDDQVAAVGSANYNFSSMTYDGELTAFVSGDPRAAQAIRQQLFDAWNMRDAAHWDADVAAPRGGPAAVRVEALGMIDFPARSVEAVTFGGLEVLNFTLL